MHEASRVCAVLYLFVGASSAFPRIGVMTRIHPKSDFVEQYRHFNLFRRSLLNVSDNMDKNIPYSCFCRFE